MTKRSLAPSIAFLVTLATAVLAALPASAQFDTDTLKCRASVAIEGLKLTKASLKALAACHKNRAGDPALEGTDCNVFSSGDLQSRIPDAEAKFALAVEARCDGVGPATALFESCPAPCDDDVPAIDDFSDVADCQVCLNRERVEHFAQEAFGSPNLPMDASAAGCHRAITKNGSRLFASAVKAVAKCQAAAEKNGATTTTVCTQTDFDSLAAAALSRAYTLISTSSRCTALTFPASDLDPCGNAVNANMLASCVAEVGLDDSGTRAAELLDLSGPDPTTTTSTTTTTLLVGDPGCPASAELLLHSRDSNIPCSDDGDCDAPRTCDESIGRCSTATDHDQGWQGLGHDADTNDAVRERVHLYCPGPADPTCGECTIQGISPQPDNCRCSSNTRVRCDTPFAEAACALATTCNAGPFKGESCGNAGDCDAGTCARRCSNDNSVVCTGDGDCPGGTCRLLSDKRCEEGSPCDSTADCNGGCSPTGGTCECYVGAPTAESSSGVPMCVVQVLRENLSGTINVDSGAVALSTSLRSRVFLGETLANPCPTCGGTCSDDEGRFCDSDSDCAMGTCNLDSTAGDGVRGGTCTSGPSQGKSCDVTATNPSLPAVAGAAGGGSYSLDCMPDTGKNVSGSGLAIQLEQGTGTSLLDADLSCGGALPELSCPCLQCSGDTSVACNSDLDCAATPSRCAMANLSCEDDGDCSSVDVGPCRPISNTMRCSKKLTMACTTNVDCTDVDVGPCDPSTCSSSGTAGFPLPNGCDDGLCSDAGGGEGECTTGPDDLFCDGLVRANGGGILACSTNDDCSPLVVGVDGGDCAVVKRRECFLDPIVGSGSADPDFPLLAVTHCLPPTASAGINVVIGRPGPARLLQQATLTSYCGMGPYAPGAGCP